jgi:hypothetical protein
MSSPHMPKRVVRSMHELATSYEGRILAGGRGVVDISTRFESRIYVWDFVTGTKLSEFDSCLQLNGRRLAISPDGKLCAVGAYHRHGIVMHDTTDGSVLWQRKDLRKVQEIDFDHAGDSLLCHVQDGGGHILDVNTGETVRKARGAHRIIANPFQDIEGHAHRRKNFKLVNLPSGKTHAVLTLVTSDPIVLAAVFSPQAVFISEMGGPISAFSVEDGKLLWTSARTERCHFVRLCFCEETNILWGMLWDYYSGEERLVALNPGNGEFLSDTKGHYVVECRFAQKGQRVIAPEGDIYDITHLGRPELVSRLDFSE